MADYLVCGNSMRATMSPHADVHPEASWVDASTVKLINEHKSSISASLDLIFTDKLRSPPTALLLNSSH